MKLFRTILLLLLVVMAVNGCSSSSGNAANTELEKVTLILDYVPNTNHTGFYVAQELGYYEQEGLVVDIIEPADNLVTTLIAAGKGDFGISYQEDVTYALTGLQPLPIKAIATIIQHNTSGFASYADKNIARPKEFENKVYAGWGAPSEEAVLRAVMVADGGDPDTLDIVVADGSGPAVLKDRVDIMWFFWAWDGIATQRAGIDVNYIELREFDNRLDYYTPVIIANHTMLTDNQEKVKRFLAATEKGYAYCVDNPQESAKILHKYAPLYDVEMLEESQHYLAGKYMEDTQKWGVMREDVWENYTAFMVENGLIDTPVAPSDCYTNEFLPE